ncbi:MAG TPA: hypothetical protein PLD91_15465 [Spirochaetota bacterium]|nr:hypothetical protein [Spirochaetota bacterium]
MQKHLLVLFNNFIGFLPNLISGIMLVLIGWALGWFAKRLVVQLAAILRLERYMLRSRWGSEFSLADVRYGFYNFIGNIAFIIILMIFIDNALVSWQLDVLSKLLSRGILYLPKIIIALIVFGLGWFLSDWSEKSIARVLHREDIPRPNLIARFIRTVLMLFFSTIALVELDLAREIVIIGFSTIFITLGCLTVVMAALGGKMFLDKNGATSNRKKLKKK